MKASKMKATIENATPELAALLKEFSVFDSHETRCRSTGRDSLYIRMSRPKPTMQVEG